MHSLTWESDQQAAGRTLYKWLKLVYELLLPKVRGRGQCTVWREPLTAGGGRCQTHWTDDLWPGLPCLHVGSLQKAIAESIPSSWSGPRRKLAAQHVPHSAAMQWARWMVVIPPNTQGRLSSPHPVSVNNSMTVLHFNVLVTIKPLFTSQKSLYLTFCVKLYSE